jgi:hypothetical protein
MQDSGFELRRRGERRSSPKLPSTRPDVGDRDSTASSFPRSYPDPFGASFSETEILKRTGGRFVL